VGAWIGNVAEASGSSRWSQPDLPADYWTFWSLHLWAATGRVPQIRHKEKKSKSGAPPALRSCCGQGFGPERARL